MPLGDLHVLSPELCVSNKYTIAPSFSFLTFENNTIEDEKGVCEIFKQLRQFEKIESLNFRCNKNFNDNIVKALAEGINLKKELRVSKKIYLYFFRQ